MKKIRISHAGCRDSVIKKLSMASSLFQGRGISSEITAWSGTRTDIVIVEINDPYGKKVCDVAIRHDIPVINVTSSDNNKIQLPSVTSIYAERPVIDFIKSIEHSVSKKGGENHTLQRDDFIAKFQPQKSPVLQHRSAKIYVDYASGLCRSHSHSDMLMLSEAIQNRLPVSQIRSEKSSLDGLGCSVSIENFFFSTLAKMSHLNWLASGNLQLKGWPDINSRQYQTEPLALSQKLLGQSAELDDLLSIAPAAVVTAYLYSTLFSGLLRVEEAQPLATLPESRKTPRSSGKAVATLKKWLGL